MLKVLGYWKAELDDEYPCPHELEAALPVELHARLLEYLRNPPGDYQVTWMYFGVSFCRYGCEEPNGSDELSDGVWVWPEGLAHYVEHHGVGLLPPEFLDRVIEGVAPANRHVADDVEEVVVGPEKLDETDWIAWGRKHRTTELTAKLAALREPIARLHTEWMTAAGHRNTEKFGVLDEPCYTAGCPGNALRINPFCGRCYAEALAVDSRPAEDEVLSRFMRSYRK